jgi:hypothetical protein
LSVAEVVDRSQGSRHAVKKQCRQITERKLVAGSSKQSKGSDKQAVKVQRGAARSSWQE